MEPTLVERKEVQKYIRDNIDIGWYVPESQLPSPCWFWNKSKTGRVYGQLWRFGEHRAHRVSYRAFKGEIPKGLWVCHECDNPVCINPDHLWLGTPKEDMEDCVKKGRQAKGEKHGMFGRTGEKAPMFGRIGEKHPMFGKGYLVSGEKNPNFGRTGEKSHLFGRIGEKHPSSKLTEDQVRQIFHRRSEGFTQNQIANEFGISSRHVSNILRGKYWRHVS